MITTTIASQVMGVGSTGKPKKNPEGLSFIWFIAKKMEIYTFWLLNGKNYYNDVILDKCKKIQANLYVIKPKLGWIMYSRVSSSSENEKENVMFTMKKTSNYLPSDIHLISTKRDTALFEPNIEEIRNLEKIGTKPKGNQERERESLVKQMFKQHNHQRMSTKNTIQ